MIFHNVEQNTPEWLQLRAGRITMSELNKIMANYGKSFGDPAKKYALNIAIEQITGEPVESGYHNSAMDDGHTLEPIARSLYEAETFQEVGNGGFFCNDKIGCSPDGVVGDGLVEIKSSITPWAHFERIRKQNIDSAYKWQVVGTLFYTGKSWLDFVSYCPHFPEDKRLFIKRVTPDMFDEEFRNIDSRVQEFMALIEQTKQTILEAKYL